MNSNQDGFMNDAIFVGGVRAEFHITERQHEEGYGNHDKDRIQHASCSKGTLTSRPDQTLTHDVSVPIDNSPLRRSGKHHTAGCGHPITTKT